MWDRIEAAFTDGPAAKKMTYPEHVQDCGLIALKTLVLGAGMAVHALFPVAFEGAAPTLVAELNRHVAANVARSSSGRPAPDSS